MTTQSEQSDQSSIDRLLEVMAKLRDPSQGCPWDCAQTFSTIARYTIEESYEVADAIARGDMNDLREELGDLLFQVVFHARMAEEEGAFAFKNVAQAIVDKMERRHPHVFGDIALDTQIDRDQFWEEQKAVERAEKKSKGEKTSALDGVALNLPALSRAAAIQKRAKRVGFDWSSLPPVVEKVREELEETLEAEHASDSVAVQEEVGDLLFAVVNLARHLNVDPETSLREATAKFDKRFRGVEEKADQAGQKLNEMSLMELDRLWDAVKGLE